jgi:hypothetical protein
MRFVRYIGDGQRGFVHREADLAALVLGARAVIDDTLRVVRIAGAGPAGLRIGEAAGELGMQRIAHVHHVQPAAAHLAAAVRSYEIDEPARRVRHDVVHAVHVGVMRVHRKRRGTAHVAQPIEIEHLHAVVA